PMPRRAAVARRLSRPVNHGASATTRKSPERKHSEVTEPGGGLFLLCFSDEEPGTVGPRRVSRQELDDAFADGSKIESVVPTHFRVNLESRIAFSEGGPRCWFAVIRRNG